MPTQGPRTRLFSEAYDGVKQGEYADWKWGDNRTQASYLARLRIDSFLRQRVVIVDTDIVDDLFFLDAGVGSLLESLPLSRIEISLRADNFNDSLLAGFYDPTELKLRPFFFSSLPAEVAIPIQAALTGAKNQNIATWKRLLQVLKSIALDAEVVERYERAWAQWMQLIDQNRVCVGHWLEPFDFPTHFDRRIRGDMPRTKQKLGETGKRVFPEIWALRHTRNLLAGKIAQLRDSEPMSAAQTDLDRIEAWYSEGYNRTRAASHDCGCVEITPSLTERLSNDDTDSDQTSKAPDKRIIEVPTSFADSVAKLDAPAWRALLNEREIAGPLADWHKQNRLDDLRRAVDVLVRRVDSLQPFESDSFLSSRVLPRIRVIADRGRELGKELGEDTLGVIPWVGRDMGSSLGALVGRVARTGTRLAAPEIERVAEDRKRRRVVASIIALERKAGQ